MFPCATFGVASKKDPDLAGGHRPKCGPATPGLSGRLEETGIPTDTELANAGPRRPGRRSHTEYGEASWHRNRSGSDSFSVAGRETQKNQRIRFCSGCRCPHSGQPEIPTQLSKANLESIEPLAGCEFVRLGRVDLTAKGRFDLLQELVDGFSSPVSHQLHAAVWQVLYVT